MNRRSAAAALTAFVAFAATAASARETVTIVDYKNRPAVRADRTALTPERIKQAMVAALQKNRWTITEDSPGRFLASQSWNNKHTMVVEITYGGASYSVAYHGSTNLNYFRYGKEGPEIHPAYNQRVKQLLDAIDSELQRA